MSIEEIVVGMAFELVDDGAAMRVRPVARPAVDVLSDVLIGLLERGRVAIGFSGGVDSSGLLCLATTLARARGLDEPVAVTARFPDAPSTDESCWQELVIGHLGLNDWVKVDFGDELDVIGAEAQVGLRRYGVRWPPMVYAEQPLMRACGASIYVIGNGGDELTFPTPAGVAELAGQGALRRRRAALGALVRDLRPELAWVPGRSTQHLPAWVRPGVRRRLAMASRAQSHRRMFSWAAALEHRTNAPWALRGHATIVASGVDAGIEVVQPLTDPSVVGAMLVAGGRWGFPDRSTAAGVLFGESLPAAVRARVDKVDFTHAYLATPSRAFIEAWDGSGVPIDLVDPDLLLAEWRSPNPGYVAIPLLQHAWLTSHSPD